MARSKDLKEDLLNKIEKLPEDRLAEALDFIQSLLKKRTKPPVLNSLDPQHDPLLRFIGGVTDGSLAASIDDELYAS